LAGLSDCSSKSDKMSEVVGSMNLQQIEKSLKEKVTETSPELQRLKRYDLIVTEINDALSDLHEREITAIASFRAFNNNIIQIPTTMSFIENIISLRRSRDRLGRQEFVELYKRRPSYIINPYSFEEESEGITEQKEGIISKLFRRKKR